MSHYLNKTENNKDYFEDEPMIRNLMDVGSVPVKLYDHGSTPLLTHMRVMYGRIDWEDFVVELDEHTISLILNLYKNCNCYPRMKKKLKPGMKVVITDGDEMTPVTYNGLMSGSNYVEVLTSDDALDKAAHWYVENLTDGFGGFNLTTIYFLIAFRLALLEEEMCDEDRFLPSRINKVWREVYASLMFQVSRKLEEAAIKMAKGSYWVNFDLADNEVEDYEASLV